MRNTFFILIFILLVSKANSQSIFGTTAWLNTPAAEMQEDGTFYVGSSFVNSNLLTSLADGKHNAFTYYFNITFLPFLEVNFGSTGLFDHTNDDNTVDRRFSMRLRVLRERKYVPAIVFGVRDIYTSIAKEANTNQYFSALFAVATKHIQVKKSEFGITLGYGFDAFRNNQFDGFFGGVTFSPSFLRQMKLIAVYDTQNFNIGADILFFKHLFVYAMLSDFQYFSGGLAYKVYLLSNVKKKKKAKKN